MLCAMFAFSSLAIGAQTDADYETETDSPELLTEESQIQVAYRKVHADDLLGSISVINMEELTRKNYTNGILDNLQGYVGGWNGNSLWAMGSGDDGYLVLVDGVPRDIYNVLPTEVEQITFLKGASAVVLYGSRAAKGVIYITTKRGKVQDLRIDVRANTGFAVSKSYPKYLGAAEYMTLYNEARENDKLSPLYSEEDIYYTASGKNPFRYPDVNFYSSDYLKKAFNRSEITAEIRGGNERTQYYTNVGFYRVDDIYKFGEAKDNNTTRLNIRGNVDVKISDMISVSVNANTTFYDARTGHGDYFGSAETLRPNRVSPLIPVSYIPQENLSAWELINNSSNRVGDYFLGGTQVDQSNVFADFYAAGSTKWTSRQFQFDTNIDFDLEQVLKGLSFRTQIAVDYNTSYTTSYFNSYAVYAPTWSNYNGEDLISGLTKYGNDEKSGEQLISSSTTEQTIAFSGQFNYLATINNSHNFTAMLIAAGYQKTQSAVYHRTSNVNLALQIGYNYRHKYFAEFGGAAIHSAKLAPGHRNAFSPSLTLGWKPSRESFLEDSPVVDDLVLSVSGSILHTDLDIPDYYMYQANYTQGDGAWWGWYDGASEKSTNSLRGGNEELTFIKRKELSANVRTSLWKKLITADASFFINTMDGGLITPSTLYPNYFFTYYPEATFIPYINYNNDRRVGFDFSVNVNKRVGEVDLSLGASGTWYTTKATQRDENYEDAYQSREGRPLDGIWGYEFAGFFENQEEINNSPQQTIGGTIRPGDMKYVDQNNDGVIDSKDMIYLGKGGWYGSPFTLGINLTAKWNNFTFFALGTGSFGGYAVKNSSYYWVYGDGKYSEVVRGRWTEDTKNSATYPRLTTETSENNFTTSDFWLYKTDRFNLAKVQITYDLPKQLFQKTFVQGISAYVSGANLLTISKEREILEMSIGTAPQTRFYNIGLKVDF